MVNYRVLGLMSKGLASTIYALASGARLAGMVARLSSSFAGLPVEFAKVVGAIKSDEKQ